MAAAREVFAERGVEASLEEIARRAGVGIGTLYRHFATRDALVEAVFERRIGDFVAVAEAAAAEPDGWRAFIGLPRADARVRRPATACSRTCCCARRRAPAASSSARAELRGCSSRCSSARTPRVSLRADFGVRRSRALLWSFAPLIDATAEVGRRLARGTCTWLLDGLRAAAATPQSEPPLSEDAMRLLRERRLGRRAGRS